MFYKLWKDVNITGYVATIENFFELHNTKYHEILFVHRAEFVDDVDRNIDYNLKNMEGNDNLQYVWLDLNELDKYPVLPTAIKNILRENIFPVHVINRD